MVNTLILGSGSYRGFLLIGGIFYLKLAGELENTKHFIGVSVGSIISALLCLDLSIPELLLEAISFGFNDGFDISKFFSYEKKMGGLIDPSRISERLEYWMIKKFKKSLTFKELFSLTGKKLSIVVTDASGPSAIYMDYLRTPDYSVSQGVMESCMIPVIFENKNRERIDGGFSDPLPIQLAESDDILIFLLQDQKNNVSQNTISTIYSNLTIPIQCFTEYKLTQCPKGTKVIVLTKQAGDIFPVSMTKEEKMTLISSGFYQTYSFFE